VSLPQSPTIREKHYPALDGLRGLAALAVVAHHSAFSYFMTNTFDKAYHRATSMLWVGVDLFFVLSGFLITNILLNSKRSPSYFRSFYARRVLRIFPLYYAFLAVLYFALPLWGIELSKSLTEVRPWLWSYTSNIYVGFHGWPNDNVGFLWTLAIEEQFYMIWPFIVFFIGKRLLRDWVVGLLVFLPFIRSVCFSFGLSTYFVYTFTVCHMDGLLLGALMSLLLSNNALASIEFPKVQRWLRRIDWSFAIVAVIGFVVYCVAVRNDQFEFQFYKWSRDGQCIGISLVSLPLAYIVLRCISPDNNLMKRAMSNRLLRKAGTVSYALYVLHAPICFWVGWNFPVPAALQNLPGEWSMLRSLYLIAIEFILSIAAAFLSWHILEKHFLKLKRYFPYRPGVNQSKMEPVAELAN